MNQNAADPRYGTANGQPLDRSGYPPPGSSPYAPPPAYGPPYGPPPAYGPPYVRPPAYGPPYGPPPAYGPPAFGPGFSPAPRRRRRIVPAALATGLAAVVAAGAVLLQPGSVSSLADSFGSGSRADSAAVTPAGAVDYDTGVVNITALLGGQGATGAGTGIILDDDGTVLTNNHVVEDATAITATDVNTGKRYSASIVGTDSDDDVAVIQLRNASGLTPASIGDSSSVTVGQKVVAIGNAGGRGGTPAVVTGQVTALGRTITATDSSGGNAETLTNLIEVDAPIVAGDSGGPLTDTAGRVIGVNTAASASQAAQVRPGSGGFGSRSGSGSGETAGYAIPISTALAIAQDLESGSGDSGSGDSGGPSDATDDRGYLGVEVTEGPNGPTVGATVEGSPAASAGITPGSVIIGVDGQRVTSTADLSSVLQDAAAGQQVSVTWLDSSGTRYSATLTLVGASA